MIPMLTKGRYSVRLASGADDIRSAQQLRKLAFRGENASTDTDEDRFDDICTHFLIEDLNRGRLVGCFRIMLLADGGQIDRSYSSQYYELSALAGFGGPMVELGRFCIHPEARDADVLRVAWAALTRFVDQNDIKMLFGCSSFKGTNAEVYLDAFAMLKDRHLAPRRWLPRVKAPSVYQFAQALRRRTPDTKLAMLCMPPLLRTYLLMGGWVSDHAVVDRDLNTLHVFTGLEISMIPASRKRLLRAVAQ